MNTQISSSFLIRLLQKIENNSALIEKIEAIIADVFLTVKSNLTLAQRIAAGKYDWKNENINETNFPHDSTTIGEWEFRLIHPNKNISSDDAKLLCEADGWETGKSEHLLAFGEEFPEEQKKFPIIALGSVCKLGGDRLVAGLWCHGSKRSLSLSDWDGRWDSEYRFLSVRRLLPNGTVVRKVKVNRSRTNQEAITATDRVEYLNYTVVAEMPTSTEEEVEINFIPFKKTLSVDALEKAVDELGFKLVDPVTLCAANEVDPAFADKYPNGTQWRDKNGKACYVIFDRDAPDDKPVVDVDQVADDWDGGWFVACVRK